MSSSRSLFGITVASASLLGLASTAWGQAVDIPMLVTGARGPSTWTSAAYAHQFQVGFDNTFADMERDSVQVVAGHRVELGDDFYAIGNLAYHGTYYHFTNGSDIGRRLLWSDIHQVTGVVGVGWKASEAWTFVALGIGRGAGEGGATARDTLTGGGALAIDYEWSENLSTGVIVGVLSQLEDSAAIVIVPTIDWSFGEDWRFRLGIVEMTYPGLGPELSWRSSGWEVAAGGSYQKRRYRLKDEGPPNKGIGEETAFPVFGRVGYSPNENVSLAVMGGVTVAGEVRSGQENGDKIFKENYNPAPFVGVQLHVRF